MEYLALGYLLGSLPFGLVLCFIFGYGDIRKIGSGNIGATNVLRTGNKVLALLTLILDISKGGIAVLITESFTGSNQFAMYAGLFAVIGHNFPVWLKFRGGKGIATTIGTIFFVNIYVGVSVIFSWIAIALLFRYSSLAGIIALILAPIDAYLINADYLIMPLSIIAIMGIIKHRENIIRLIKGTEPKIKFKK